MPCTSAFQPKTGVGEQFFVFDNKNKKKVKFEEKSYSYDELLNLKFKLVLNTDYYVKEKGIWINKSDDEEYMKNLIKNSEEVKIVGIIKQNEEAVGGSNSYGMVGYQ